MRNANSAETMFRKKDFCMAGTSPAMLTNRFMTAKQKDERMMKKIPLYSCAPAACFVP